jgi:hypothetical protein
VAIVDKEQEFDTRIAEIHSLRHAGGTMNARHEEFKAMTDVFLGPNYNDNSLQMVEQLQIELHRAQAVLVNKYQSGELSPSDYVDAVNALSVDTFRMCEKILGPMDFQKLFGVSPGVQAGLIDKATFLNSHSAKR